MANVNETSKSQANPSSKPNAQSKSSSQQNQNSMPNASKQASSSQSKNNQNYDPSKIKQDLNVSDDEALDQKNDV